MSTPVITKFDLTNPPPRETCEAGQKYTNNIIFYGDFHAECQSNDAISNNPITNSTSPVYEVIGQGTLPNGEKYRYCIKPADGYLKVLKVINPLVYNTTKAMTTNCPVKKNATMQAASGPICELNNQVYDANIQTCVSCRDPSAAAPTVLKAPDSNNTVNNNRILGGQYKCINAPIKTYDPSGNLLNQTCDSGENLTKDKMCEITFWAKNK